MKSWLTGKDPDAGKNQGQEEEGTTEDEMAGWHHRLKDMSLSKLWETVKDREAWRAAAHGVTKTEHQMPIKLHKVNITTTPTAENNWAPDILGKALHALPHFIRIVSF